MADLGDSSWSETDASNNATTPNGWPEGMNPSDVNNCARADKGGVKRFWDRTNTTQTTGGTSTAYTLTYAVAAASYYSGEEFGFIVNATCGATPTLNINGLGAANIRKFVSGAWANCGAGDLLINQTLRVYYNSSVPSFDIVASSNFFPPPTSATTTFMGGDQALNNTALFFPGPNTGSIGASGQVWMIMGVAVIADTSGTLGNGVTLEAVIYNGSTYVADVTLVAPSNLTSVIPLMAAVTLSGPTTFTLQAKAQTNTSGVLRASGTVVSNKATSITAIRLS